MKKLLFWWLVVLFCHNGYASAEEAWTHLTEINGIEIGEIISLKNTENGDIWISSMTQSNKSVFHYDGFEWYNESEHLESYIYDIAIAPNGDIWFCSHDSTLINYDGNEWNTIKTQRYIIDIAVDNNNHVWGCSSLGVYKYDGSDWTTYTTDDGLAWQGANHIVVNNDNEPWIRYADPYDFESTFDGVSYFNGELWETFNVDNGLPSNRVYDIAFDNGYTYVSYGKYPLEERGILRYDGNSWEKITSITGSLTFDYDGNLWATARSSHAFKFDGVSWYEYIHDPNILINDRTAIDNAGKVWLGTGNGLLILDESVLAVQEDDNTPEPFTLFSNYPNPFNANTVISYNLSHSDHVTLSIYNMSGQKVATLVDGTINAGMHQLQFDGSELASGQYIARLETAGAVQSIPMVLIK